MSTIQVGIRIPSHLFQRPKEHADRVNASKTEVILSALAQYLESTGDTLLPIRMTEAERRLAALENEKAPR